MKVLLLTNEGHDAIKRVVCAAREELTEQTGILEDRIGNDNHYYHEREKLKQLQEAKSKVVSLIKEIKQNEFKTTGYNAFTNNWFINNYRYD